MFSICGGLALILATVGLAGVVIHAVSRRRGSSACACRWRTPRDLASDVLSSSACSPLPGLVAGVLLAARPRARLVQVVFSASTC